MHKSSNSVAPQIFLRVQHSSCSCEFLSWESNPLWLPAAAPACLPGESYPFNSSPSVQTLQVNSILLFPFSYSFLNIRLFNVWVSPPGTNNLDEDSCSGCQFHQRVNSIYMCLISHFCYSLAVVFLSLNWLCQNICVKTYFLIYCFIEWPFVPVPLAWSLVLHK